MGIGLMFIMKIYILKNYLLEFVDKLNIKLGEMGEIVNDLGFKFYWLEEDYGSERNEVGRDEWVRKRRLIWFWVYLVECEGRMFKEGCIVDCWRESRMFSLDLGGIRLKRLL